MVDGIHHLDARYDEVIHIRLERSLQRDNSTLVISPDSEFVGPLFEAIRAEGLSAVEISDTDVEQARAMISMGIPKAEVARTFGVSRQTLYTSLRRQASD